MQIACRYCHEGKMSQEFYNETFKFGRSSLAVEGLVRFRCNHCASIMVKPSQLEHNSELIELAKSASPSFVSLGTLREFRMKYNLSQREASKLIGAGEGAFGKYESGENLSAPTAKLIRAALTYPEVVRLLADEANMQIDFSDVHPTMSSPIS
nr:type II TA system antitoxin MqsA family protein [Massilia polaris]